MLALTKRGQLADLFGDEGELVVVLTIDEEGNRHTKYETRNMNATEVWAICEELALSCRLRRMGGWHDPREVIETLGREGEAKVYINYKPHRQDFSWTRVNLSYLDAEIALMIASEIAKHNIFTPGSVT